MNFTYKILIIFLISLIFLLFFYFFRKIIFLEQKIKKEEKIVEREVLLRNIIEIIRSSLDLKEMKKSLVQNVAKYFNADRCFLFEYDRERDIYLPITVEYLSSPDIKSILNKDIYKEAEEFVKLVKSGKNNIIKDSKIFIKENGESFPIAVNFLKKYNIKSDYGFGIFYKNTYLGSLVVNFVKDKKCLTDEDLRFLELFVSQAGTMLYQSELYEKEKKTAKRESLLREITGKIRTSLDLNEALSFICEETAKVFDVQRVAITVFLDPNNYEQFIIKKEYKTTPELKGVAYTEDFLKVGAYWGFNLIKEGDTLAFDNISESDAPDYFKNTYNSIGIKSIIGTSIRKGKDAWGTLILSEYKNHRHWTDEEKGLLKTIADQVYLAINQAELYEAVQETAQNERVLRQIMLSSVNTFNFEDIINTIVNETGKLFNADRCFFVGYDPVTYTSLPIKAHAEYLSSKDIRSHTTRPPLKEETRVFAEARKKSKTVVVDNVEKSDLPKATKHMLFDDLSVKSFISVPINYGEISYGSFVLHYVNNYKKFTQNEITLVQAIASQSAIVLHHTELFNKVEEFANKEKLLREIISNIKLTHNLDKIYNYLSNKMSEVFKVNKVLFIDTSKFAHKNIIKYEFNSNSNMPLLKNYKFTAECLNKLILMANEPSIEINDINNHFPKESVLYQLFNEYHIKSILGCPIIKHNEETIKFGMFILCSQQQRNWTEYEISLLKEILNTSTTVIWEIIKRNELDEVRNTFILTLAHDLEVPLIGERRALEFIMAIPPGQLLDKYKNLIEEVIKDNIDLSNFLKRLVDSYNYELGRKKLHKVKTNIADLLNEVIDSQKDYAKNKLISINIDFEDNLPHIKVDQDEIKKVINTFLNNAVTYSSRESTIAIKSNLKENNILICTIDNGPGIPTKVRKRLFKRYEMALSTERKIGSGLGLYLAKQIIEAHGGDIWFVSEEGIGTTFCVSLPVN